MIEAAIDHVIISTPGRICLFGEHQDYLQLPVIACAISLRITIEGRQRSDSEVCISMPDVASTVSFSLNGSLQYKGKRDYFRSAVNVLRRNGFTFTSGIDCTVRGEIPINAGTSSSSALVVSWVNFLARMSDQRKILTAEECARFAHAAEVLEFHEPGGMMDQYSTAFGGVLFLQFYPRLTAEQLFPPLGSFVLGDSGEPKDTTSILSRVKASVVKIVDGIAFQYRNFSLQEIKHSQIEMFKKILSKEEYKLLEATLRNRDITFEAIEVLRSPLLDEPAFGGLLNEHQAILRDILQISTPEIDKMLDAAMKAGACGGKINGSGGGGCMFVYAPKNPEVVADAIERAGGKAYIVNVDTGTRVEQRGILQ